MLKNNIYYLSPLVIINNIVVMVRFTNLYILNLYNFLNLSVELFVVCPYTDVSVMNVCIDMSERASFYRKNMPVFLPYKIVNYVCI